MKKSNASSVQPRKAARMVFVCAAVRSMAALPLIWRPLRAPHFLSS
jgi:hypothetical protein